ncbi:antibiotic biosynthesis monooxygenase family protein [Nonomuraea sp. NPDC050556]|uniref:antibiotic biosynthesis monooxygenase family protein n=1 Tax=Nonomuraea sp. NPDC050556 TaxID=3364369 RepID=UPI0037B9E08C
MKGRARVMVWYLAPTDDPDVIERSYEQISGGLAGTPGLIGNELLKRADDPRRVMVMSEWEDLASFQKWETGADHRSTTSPLRPFVDRYEIYEVVSAF